MLLFQNLLTAAAPAIISGVSSAFGQRSANRQNVALAEKRMSFEDAQAARQMEFQERMSSTAYQRAMGDMRKAGLNPMLAFQQGGASSPVGASGSGAQAQVEDAIGPGVSSAMEALSLRKALKLQDEQIVKTREEAKSARAKALYDEAYTRAHGITRTPSGGIHFDIENPGILAKVRAEINSAVAAAELTKSQVPRADVWERIWRLVGTGQDKIRDFGSDVQRVYNNPPIKWGTRR